MKCFVMTLVVTLIVSLLAIQETQSASSSWWDQHVAELGCTQPGYFVNPADCRKFFRCVDRSTWSTPALVRYDFNCPDGMAFDPTVSVCSHPGPNGCATPWWQSSGGDGFGSGPGSGFGGGGSVGGNGGIFQSSRPGGSRPGRPGGNRPGGGGSGGDIFQSSRPGRPGGNRPGAGGGGLGDDGIFQSSRPGSRPGGSGSSRPSGGGNRPGDSGSWFNRPGAGASGGNNAGVNRPAGGANPPNSGGLGQNTESTNPPGTGENTGGGDDWLDIPAGGNSGGASGGFDGPDLGVEDDEGNKGGLNEDKPGSANAGGTGAGQNRPSSNPGSRPGGNTFGSRPTKPGSSGLPSGGFGGGNDVDPLDIEFGQSSNPPAASPSGSGGKPDNSNSDDSTPNANCPNCDDDSQSDEDNALIEEGPGGNGSWGNKESSPSTTPGASPGPNKPAGSWGSNNRNQFRQPDGNQGRQANGNQFRQPNGNFGGTIGDYNKPGGNRGSGNSGRNRPGGSSGAFEAQTNPGITHWGGAGRPAGPDNSSPWRPVGPGPWGSSTNRGSSEESAFDGSSNETPGSGRGANGGPASNWWNTGSTLSPPPSNPMGHANPFRPQFPSYQIVAYPTWPGPYGRSPVLIVYSNSKK